MQRVYRIIYILMLAVPATQGHAQTARTQKNSPETKWLHKQISALTASNLYGRGYVNNGVNLAAKYMVKRYREIGLAPVKGDSTYTQPYYFGVNTFPAEVYLKLNKTELVPGVDYLADAASAPLAKDNLKISKVDLNSYADSNALNAAMADWNTEKKPTT